MNYDIDPYPWQVGKCLKVSGTRPAFYHEGSGEIFVAFMDEPLRWKRYSRTTFRNLFVRTWPDGNERIRRIFEEMPDYAEWRDREKQESKFDAL